MIQNDGRERKPLPVFCRIPGIATTKQYICEDIRMDSDDLREMNTDILTKYADNGKKANSIRTLIR